jgi:ankyrin repeat protein
VIKTDGSRLLHFAAEHGNIILANKAIKYGANVNNLFRCSTPLIRAIIHSPRDVIDLLIRECGACLDLRDGCGKTALWHAIEIGDIETMKTLLEQGANHQVKDNDGKTLLHLAIQKRMRTAVDTFLDKSGCEIDVRNKDKKGSTPLHEATRSKGNISIVKALLRKDNAKFVLNSANKNGETPFSLATTCHDMEVSHLLLQQMQFDPNILVYGRSYLAFIAATQGSKLFESLLNHRKLKIPPEGYPNDGLLSRAVLFSALHKEYQETITIILKERVRLGIGSSDLYFAAQRARERHCHNIAKLIEECVEAEDGSRNFPYVLD